MPLREALIRRNAEACANAKYKSCKCHCGGKLHGKAHSEKWIRATFRELTGQRELLEDETEGMRDECR